MSTHAPGPVTISQVADAAGVSRATVSRVMNGSTSVAPDLADRVRAAARSLHYAPNAVARSLAVGRTATIALIVPDLSNPMFQGVLRSLNHAADAAGHRLLVADSHESPSEEPSIALDARRRCDGLVLCAPRMSADELKALAPDLSPFVLINRDLPELDAPSVIVDYAAGIRDLVGHLVGLGHRRLAYLSGPATSASHMLRLDALDQLVAAHDLDLTVIDCGSMFADGHAAAGHVVDSEVTAVVAYNDLVAFGALSGLHELGVSVPGRVSVVGFDDIPFALYTTPPLTTAAVPVAELGRHAWDRLAAVLDRREPPAGLRIRPRLVVRGSTAAPAPARR